MSKKQELQPNIPRDTYQTGVTDPPKKHSGLITGLFMAVIFLCGIVTALGAMNVRLVWQVSGETPPAKTMSTPFVIGTRAVAIWFIATCA